MQTLANKTKSDYYFANGIRGLDINGPSWTPSAISTAMWLDANDSSTITIATGVSQWNDKSGNNRNATQVTSANQPLFVENVFNNKSIIRFDGSNDTLSYTGSFLVNTNYTIIGLYARRSNKIENYVLSGSSTSPNNSNLVFGWLSNTSVQLNQWGNDFTATVAGYTTGIAEIFEVSHSTTSGKLIRQNGTIIGTKADNVSISGYTGSNIGFQPFEGTYYNGDVGEIIYLTTTPSTSTRELIEGYLAWKWGIEASLPANHPYKNSPPAL